MKNDMNKTRVLIIAKIRVQSAFVRFSITFLTYLHVYDDICYDLFIPVQCSNGICGYSVNFHFLAQLAVCAMIITFWLFKSRMNKTKIRDDYSFENTYQPRSCHRRREYTRLCCLLLWKIIWSSPYCCFVLLDILPNIFLLDVMW